jgi:hypothetical protein
MSAVYTHAQLLANRVEYLILAGFTREQAVTLVYA